MCKHNAAETLQLSGCSVETFTHITRELSDKGWVVVDNFLPFEWVSELLEEHQLQLKQGAFRQAGVGRNEEYQLNTTMRSDKILWLDQGNAMSAQRQYLNLLEQLRLAVNRDLYLGLYELEVHAATYPRGSFYQRHLDVFQQGNLRALTTILYLNPRWHSLDGGMLRFYLEEGTEETYMDIFPESGRLVVFLSDRFHHEVLPTKRERSSITGWFSRRPVA